VSVDLVYHIKHASEGWRAVLEKALREIASVAEVNDVSIRVGDILRSIDQNKKQWPMLRDIAQRVPMVINGTPQRADEKQWKALLTAIFTKEATLWGSVPGSNVVVALGISTSNMPMRVFSEYIEFLYSFGTEHEVVWSEKALEHYEQYRPTRLNGEVL
jgi:hypothetical protein